MGSYSIFVGHLATETTKKELTALFSECGHVKGVFINPKEEDLKYTYGFVRFREPEAVVKAAQEVGHWTLHGNTLRVEISHETKKALQLITPKRYPSSRLVRRDLDSRARVKEGCLVLNKELDLIHDLESRPVRGAPRVRGSVGSEAVSSMHSVLDSIGALSADPPPAIEQKKEAFRQKLSSLQNDLVKLHLESELRRESRSQKQESENCQPDSGVNSPVNFTEQDDAKHCVQPTLKKGAGKKNCGAGSGCVPCQAETDAVSVSEMSCCRERAPSSCQSPSPLSSRDRWEPAVKTSRAKRTGEKRSPHTSTPKSPPPSSFCPSSQGEAASLRKRSSPGEHSDNEDEGVHCSEDKESSRRSIMDEIDKEFSKCEGEMSWFNYGKILSRMRRSMDEKTTDSGVSGISRGMSA